jgi:hypothetical protein
MTDTITTPERGHQRICIRGAVYVHLHADPPHLTAALDEIRMVAPAFTVFGPLVCDLHGGCRRAYVVVLPRLHPADLLRLRDRLGISPAFAGTHCRHH